MDELKRTYWHSNLTLNYVGNEWLIVSLLKYRANRDRVRTPAPGTATEFEELMHNEPNLVASKTESGKQAPILDLDYPHTIEVDEMSGRSYLCMEAPKHRAWVINGIWRWLFS